MKIGIISDTATKKSERLPASDMFSSSAYFRYSLAYAKEHYDKVLICSAKYGIIKLDEVIDPYDAPIETFRADELDWWKYMAAGMFMAEVPNDSDVYILFGDKYRPLVDAVKEKSPEYGGKFRFHFPLEDVGGIGKQLKFLKENTK